MIDSNDYWESARKESEHEQIMEGIGNMIYDDALFEFCEKNDFTECICGSHTHSECGNKLYREMLTDDEDFMVKRYYKEKYEKYIREHSCSGCGRMIISQPLTQASTGKKFHNNCYPHEEEY